MIYLLNEEWSHKTNVQVNKMVQYNTELVHMHVCFVKTIELLNI